MRVGFLRPSVNILQKLMVADATDFVRARNLPMLIEPRPWHKYDRGGYLKLRTKVMRTHGAR